MAKHDDQVTLRQMRDAARKALIVVGGHLRPDLDEDWIGALALMQLLQIIGEARDASPTGSGRTIRRSLGRRSSGYGTA